MRKMEGKNGYFSNIYTPKYVLMYENASAYQN